MNNLTTLCSNRGFTTTVDYEFDGDFSSHVRNRDVDTYIMATDHGFSPLGQASPFLAYDLGIPHEEIRELATWNQYENEKITLIALESRRSRGLLRGVVLAPCNGSKCYEPFAERAGNDPSRDFYYNVTYEAIAHVGRVWKARRPGMSHLTVSNFHEDVATCNAEALAHFCDEATEGSALDSFAFVGCCITREHLNGIKRLNAEGDVARHREITMHREFRDEVELIHLSWE